MMDERDEEVKKTREINYILWTVIVILGLMLINLFAHETCQNEVFVEQVSFASTISSIILSVIAIIMTVVSNDSIGSLLHRFRDLHDDIKEVPEELRKTVKGFNASCEELKGIEKNLDVLPKELNEAKVHIKDVTILIKSFVERLDAIDERTYTVNKALDELKDSLFSNSCSVTTEEKSSVLQEDDIKKLLKEIPYMGKVTIYVALKCCQEKKILDICALAKALNVEKFLGYFLAILLMFQLLDLISYTKMEQEIMKYKINKVDKYISKNEALFTPLIRKDDTKKYREIIERYLAECMTFAQYDEKQHASDK